MVSHYPIPQPETPSRDSDSDLEAETSTASLDDSLIDQELIMVQYRTRILSELRNISDYMAIQERGHGLHQISRYRERIVDEVSAVMEENMEYLRQLTAAQDYINYLEDELEGRREVDRVNAEIEKEEEERLVNHDTVTIAESSASANRVISNEPFSPAVPLA